MNIVIVSQYFYPDDFRINDIAKRLVADGHAVRVITGLPDYAESKVPKEYRFFKKRRETLDGIDISRVSIVARRKGVFFRALNYASFVFFGGLRAAFFDKKGIDLVLSYETSPVLQVLPAIRLAKRAKAPLFVYCLDIWPECLKAWHVREDQLLYKLMTRMSRRIYQKADRLAVTSEPFRGYLRRLGVDGDRIEELPQHAVGEAAPWQDNGCVDFVYTGNIGAAQQADVIIKAAALLKRENLPFRVHMVGNGSEKARNMKLAEDLEVGDSVVFHGKHPVGDMPGFYSLADCLLLTLSADGPGALTLPAKLQGYMAAGKPILAADTGASAKVLDESGSGWHVAPGDAVKMAEAMKKIIDTDMAVLKAKGEKGRRYYERHYTLDIFMENFYGIFDRIAERPDGVTYGEYTGPGCGGGRGRRPKCAAQCAEELSSGPAGR